MSPGGRRPVLAALAASAVLGWAGCVGPSRGGLGGSHGGGGPPSPPGADEPADSAPDDTATPALQPTARLHPELGSLVYVSWDQPVAATAWVEHSFDPGEWHTSPPVPVGPGPQEQLLLGIPYGARLTWRVVYDAGQGPIASGDAALEVGPVPAGAPSATVLIDDEPLQDPDSTYLYTSVSGPSAQWRVVVDRRGRLVWAQANPPGVNTFYVRVSAQGDALLWDTSSFFPGTPAQVTRARIDGTVVQIQDTPGLHHAFVELPDGSLIWGAYVDGVETLEHLAPDGTQQTLWQAPQGYVSNSLFYDVQRDSLLYSSFTNDTVLELDLSTWDERHRWGGPDEPGAWTFEPSVSRFVRQHGVTFTGAGTLLLSCNVSANSEEGVVREYRLDEARSALVEIYSFGINDGIEAPSYGEAHRLGNGNTLHNYGSNPRLREATPGGRVVWDLLWSTGDPGLELVGRSVFLPDLYALAPRASGQGYTSGDARRSPDPHRVRTGPQGPGRSHPAAHPHRAPAGPVLGGGAGRGAADPPIQGLTPPRGPR